MIIRAALAAVGLLLGAGLALGQNPAVAKKHQALYNQLEGQLVQFASQIPAGSTQHSVLRGAAWTAAGCEPVPTLLDESRRGARRARAGCLAAGRRAARDAGGVLSAPVRPVPRSAPNTGALRQSRQRRAAARHAAAGAKPCARPHRWQHRCATLLPAPGQAALLQRALWRSEEHRAGAATGLPHAGSRAAARRRGPQAHPARLAQLPAQDHRRSARAARGLRSRFGCGSGPPRTASSWSIRWPPSPVRPISICAWIGSPRRRTTCCRGCSSGPSASAPSTPASAS